MGFLPEDIKLSHDEILRDYALQRAIDFINGQLGDHNQAVRIAEVFERYLRHGNPE